MIRGLHGLFYSSDADGARAFMRDKLRLPCTDIGRGWLIFDLPEADLGVHPIEADDGAASGKHDVSFYCDDIKGTVADLRKRGVVFKQEPADHGYGYVTYFAIPGGIEVQLYEPKYSKKKKARARKPASKRNASRVAAAAKSKPKKKAVKRKRRSI